VGHHFLWNLEQNSPEFLFLWGENPQCKGARRIMGNLKGILISPDPHSQKQKTDE